MGADLVIDPAHDSVREAFTDHLCGVGADVVLACSGAESAVNLAIELVRPGGRIALVGMSHEPISVSTLKMYLKGVQMSSVRDIDLTGGMELLRQKRVDYREFVAQIVPLEQVPEAFEAQQRPEDQIKVVAELLP